MGLDSLERLDKINDDTEIKRKENFLADIVEVCIKHGLSISHEDGHGGFIIEAYDQNNIKWLMNAAVQIQGIYG